MIRKYIPYFYFVVAIAYVTNRIIYLMNEEVNEYYLLFGKTTDSKTTYIAFTVAVTLCLLFLGYRRLHRPQ